jgi:23S rRNA (uracil1939-C5)-methyltransferase
MTSGETIRIGEADYGGTFGGTFDSGGVGELSFVLPGELVQAPVADGLPIVLEASPDRVAPRCEHFGACGGCQYQHAAYDGQMGIKAEILRGIFARAGLEDVPAIRARHAEAWGYRNRIRLRVERAADGFRVGYSRRGTNEFLPIRECPIAAPLLWRAAEALIRLSATDANSGRWLAAASEVELFCDGNESRLQMTFYLREASRDGGSFPGFCGRIQAVVPELVGAGAELDPELNRRVRRRWDGMAWGSPGLNYEVAGRTYWVSRGAFFQVNRWLVDGLLEVVCEEEKGTLAWDLFAGVGLFTRALAERFERVVAVEAGAEAAADLAIAGKGGKGRPAFEAVHASTLKFLKVNELQRERPELIVLDPPRAGVGAAAAAVLARIGAARVVYCSCDPETLARDLAVLTRDVYRIESVDLVDLFPQTFHLETVVRLSRR